MKISIAKAAEILGVSITTLRRWDEEGKLKADRTPAGHRRYELAKLRQLAGQGGVQEQDGEKTAVYARITDSTNLAQLEAHTQQLRAYCQERGWGCAVFSDAAEEENGRLPGLVALIHSLCTRKFNRLLLLNHDHLSRSGLNLLLNLCAEAGVELLILNVASQLTRPVKQIEPIVAQILAKLS